MHVEVGDDVRLGQLLFEDKKMPGVRYTSPASGTVVAINRGSRRSLQSIVIKLSRDEREGRTPTQSRLTTFSGRHPSALSSDDIRELLIESGLWVSFRGRPFSRVANPKHRPHSIFVTAIDTQPLAPSLDVVMKESALSFELGLKVLCRLTDGPVFVCTSQNSSIQVPGDDQIIHERFLGPHPAGTVGLHIHTLDAVDRRKLVWYLGVQDLIAFGHLFKTGSLDVSRIVSLAGPPVMRPRLLSTRVGAALDDLVAGQVEEGENRIISGSVLSGRSASGDVFGYLGRYHQQISVLSEGRSREFLGWLSPGWNKFSVTRTFISSLLRRTQFRLNTSTNGSRRSIVPIGVFEKVMAFDLMPTPLLRALLVGDVDRAEELGCLELDEEDLALCTFVCPGKNDYGRCLRSVLNIIEKEEQ
jgi:Na+-transporting NADH:ubiquinone oxidoreductase subunit A